MAKSRYCTSKSEKYFPKIWHSTNHNTWVDFLCRTSTHKKNWTWGRVLADVLKFVPLMSGWPQIFKLMVKVRATGTGPRVSSVDPGWALWTQGELYEPWASSMDPGWALWTQGKLYGPRVSSMGDRIWPWFDLEGGLYKSLACWPFLMVIFFLRNHLPRTKGLLLFLVLEVVVYGQASLWTACRSWWRNRIIQLRFRKWKRERRRD